MAAALCGSSQPQQPLTGHYWDRRCVPCSHLAPICSHCPGCQSRGGGGRSFILPRRHRRKGRSPSAPGSSEMRGAAGSGAAAPVLALAATRPRPEVWSRGCSPWPLSRSNPGAGNCSWAAWSCAGSCGCGWAARAVTCPRGGGAAAGTAREKSGKEQEIGRGNVWKWFQSLCLLPVQALLV